MKSILKPNKFQLKPKEGRKTITLTPKSGNRPTITLTPKEKVLQPIRDIKNPLANALKKRNG